MPEDLNVTEDSEVVEDSNASEESKVLENTTNSRPTSSAIDPPVDILYPMDPPAPVAVPVPPASPPSVPMITVIQCAFCSDTFEEAQQLQAHVLAAHTKTRKRPRSPENTFPMRKTRQGNLPKKTEKPSTNNEESFAQEDQNHSTFE